MILPSIFLQISIRFVFSAAEKSHKGIQGTRCPYLHSFLITLDEGVAERGSKEYFAAA